jgi:hypothetical protein
MLPRPRASSSGEGSGAASAFTSYIARDDLHTAISKYRASNCRDAYYLLTEVGGWMVDGWVWEGGVTKGAVRGGWR